MLCIRWSPRFLLIDLSSCYIWGLISQEQSAFVAGRSIIDNAMIESEVVHYLKKKVRGNRGDMPIIFFCRKCVLMIGGYGGLCSMWRRFGILSRWIMILLVLCYLAGYYAKWSAVFLFIYFILCAKGLSFLIKKAKSSGLLHGFGICRGAPKITHLLFANDSILFFRAIETECLVMKNLLLTYEVSSGQAINFDKYMIFFSSNVPSETRNSLSNVLGIHASFTVGKYLGLPSIVGGFSSGNSVLFRGWVGDYG